ncbi:MAG TPA: hypothetical protein VLN26_05630 [Gaiellaceae bacterium]|nr:hypothetical protein [Gaiellaceae bacterium]
MRRLAPVLLAALALGLAAPAAARTPPLLGIRGDAARFADLTGQRSTVVHQIVGWGQGQAWGSGFAQLLGTMGDVPMLGIGTSAKWPSRAEAITPHGIAFGQGDGYLVALNRAIADFAKPLYIRPLGEMNGHWNLYCAFTKAGKAKPRHSTADFRKAFARIYLILHGGDVAAVDAKLKRLGLPPVAAQQLAATPYPQLRVVWNPQGYGAPDIPANSAQAYYPGDAYVDVVGNDLYDIRGKAEWAANEALYRAHPGKPYAFPEWGLWGIDDPVFVRTMATFVKTHARVQMLAYFESAPGSIFDLASKPASKAAYRAAITPLG